MDDAIIALSEGSSLTLEEQLDEAIEDDNFEMAAKIKKLIEKRDSKNKSE
jgi:protein-arginine kinase activator protein McsA